MKNPTQWRKRRTLIILTACILTNISTSTVYPNPQAPPKSPLESLLENETQKNNEKAKNTQWILNAWEAIKIQDAPEKNLRTKDQKKALQTLTLTLTTTLKHHKERLENNSTEETRKTHRQNLQALKTPIPPHSKQPQKPALPSLEKVIQAAIEEISATKPYLNDPKIPLEAPLKKGLQTQKTQTEQKTRAQYLTKKFLYPQKTHPNPDQPQQIAIAHLLINLEELAENLETEKIKAQEPSLEKTKTRLLLLSTAKKYSQKTNNKPLYQVTKTLAETLKTQTPQKTLKQAQTEISLSARKIKYAKKIPTPKTQTLKQTNPQTPPYQTPKNLNPTIPKNLQNIIYEITPKNTHP